MLIQLQTTNSRLVYEFMVFNATFSNISTTSWRSVLLMEETGVPGENHQHVASLDHTLYHIMLYLIHLAICSIRTHILSGDSH